MARTQPTESGRSFLGTVAKLGLAAGAVQLLRSSTVRTKVSETFDSLKDRIRKGAGETADDFQAASHDIKNVYDEEVKTAGEELHASTDKAKRSANEKLHDAGESVKATADKAKHAASEKLHEASDSIKAAADKAGEKLHDAGESVKAAADKAKHAASEVFSQPVRELSVASLASRTRRSYWEAPS